MLDQSELRYTGSLFLLGKRPLLRLVTLPSVTISLSLCFGRYFFVVLCFSFYFLLFKGKVNCVREKKKLSRDD
jgi:hypothetical protein